MRRILHNDEFGVESGPSSRNIPFPADFVDSTPESRRGAEGQSSSALDIERTFGSELRVLYIPAFRTRLNWYDALRLPQFGVSVIGMTLPRFGVFLLLALLVMTECTRDIRSGDYGPVTIGQSKPDALAALNAHGIGQISPVVYKEQRISSRPVDNDKFTTETFSEPIANHV